MVGRPIFQSIVNSTLELEEKTISSVNENSLLMLVIAISGVYFFTKIVPRIADSLEKPEQNVTLEGALALIECLDRVVDVKSARFNDYLSALPVNADCNTTFSTITKPDQQILLITSSLQAFLSQLFKKNEVSVVLAEIDKKKPLRWYAYSFDSSSIFPNQESIDDIQDKSSTLMHCLRDKKIIVIPDTKKEGNKRGQHRRYLWRDGESSSSSFLCYPVYHQPTSTVPFVICIRVDKPGVFDPKKKELYNWILSMYSKRIALEYSLLKIKEGTNH